MNAGCEKNSSGGDNGGFSDLTGLTNPGGDWRSGVPAGWISSMTNPGYTVDVSKGAPPPVANLQTLSVLSQNAPLFLLCSIEPITSIMYAK